MGILSPRAVSYVALAGALLGVALMAARGYFAISFSEPMQLITSGAEYESLYVIWKYVQGLTLYADHTRIPFAGTFYNWIYYYFYGGISGGVLSALSLGDEWLPTVTRLITAAGATYGAWISALLFRRLPGVGNPHLSRLGLALALLIFFGPLMGFFGIATAPDVWGFAFDVTAIYFFLRFYDTRPAAGIILFWLFAYLAWGFKQIFVFSTGTVGLFLLFRRDWKMLALLAVVSWLAWGVTLALGTAQYGKTILSFGGSTVSLAWPQLSRNLGNFAVKTLPLLLGLAGILAAVIWTSRARPLIGQIARGLVRPGENIPLAVAVLGCVVTGGLAIPASAKLGAAENYYYLLSFFLALLLLTLAARMEKAGGWPALVSAPLTAGWILHGAAIGLVFFGVTGVLSTRYMHTSLSAARACLAEKNLAQPVFIGHPYLSLPWMVPAKAHFVVQTNYRWDRARGVEMEGGGIGGLIDKGYFATIVLSGDSVDGSDLRLYRRRGEPCGDFKIYGRSGAQ